MTANALRKRLSAAWIALRAPAVATIGVWPDRDGVPDRVRSVSIVPDASGVWGAAALGATEFGAVRDTIAAGDTHGGAREWDVYLTHPDLPVPRLEGD